MTAVAASGTIDCSGVVSRILQLFREVGQRIAADVKGNPELVDVAAAQQSQQSRQLTQLSTQARQRTTSLAANWQGGAYDAYAAMMTRTCAHLDDASGTLAAQSQRLGAAAAALRDATQRMTTQLADFDGRANRLIALSHASAPGAVQSFYDAANTLGESLVTVSRQTSEDLSRALDALSGNDPTKPEANDYGTRTKLDASVQKWLGNQPWFRKWYAEHGHGDDPTRPRFGKLDDLKDLDPKEPEATTAAGRLAQNTTGTVWKYDNDGKPLFRWGTGGTATARTDLGSSGAAGAEAKYFVGPQGTLEAKAGWEGNQASVDLGGKVTVLDAKAGTYATVGPATVQANGEASVGANAGINAKLGTDGVQVKADAFAGGKVEGAVAGDVGGVGAGLNGSLRYGVGAQLNADASFDDGHLKVGFRTGLEVGVGGTVGGSIDINVPKVWDTYEHYDPAGAQVLRDGATWVGNTAHQASDAVGHAIDWVEGT